VDERRFEMAVDQTFVVVGASLCGAKAAETLREQGFDGRVVLIGAEPDLPYERPPLSKTYLRRESAFDEAAVHDLDYYEQHQIELRLSTTVTRVDPMQSALELASGERISYDRLLLATGAAPRHLSVPGSDLDGILYLRMVRDSDAIHDAVTASVPVVVIGAGWIGAEVAASARQLGAEVTMIDVATVPLERVMGKEVGGVYRDLHADHGVALRLGIGIESIGGAEVVEEVRLSDGSVVPAGVIVVGVGVTPRTDLAEACGIEVENGVMTDEYLATTAPGVYAAGDVANALHPLYDRHIRLEHWSAALNQGPAAAKNMLGQPTPYDKTPYFFSDQYDLGMEYRGWAPEFDEVVFRGDPTSGEFLSFWLHRGRVVAAMNANVWDQSEAIDALVRKRPPVEPARLADPTVELTSLAGSG
jgi:3-phenylpropionate/trans-cinnamate dioxygenase ferredoxin reductase subunit